MCVEQQGDEVTGIYLSFICVGGPRVVCTYLKQQQGLINWL